MTQNPFESPRVRDAQTFSTTTTGTFDVMQTVRDAWAAISKDFGTVIGVSIVGMLLMFLAEITIIGLFVVVPVLVWGAVKFGLNLIDGKEAGFNDLFAGFSNYGPALGSMLLLWLCTFVLLIPGYGLMGIGAATESAVPVVLGYAVLFATLFGVMLRLYFAMFFIVEQGMGAIDALKASWEITREQKLNTFLLTLLAGVVGAAGVFACGIGAFVSIPMSYLMYASAYRQMVGPQPE